MKLKRLWGPSPMQSSFDAVIIGGGIHGLATAYFLAKNHCMGKVAVIERKFVGYGGSCRNTAIVRANQKMQANVRFYKEGLALWPKLMAELDFNMMFHKCGMMDLLHSDDDIAVARKAVSTANFCGVQSEILDRRQTRDLVPELNFSEDINYPVIGSPGGILRHVGVTWGLAKGAAQYGVHIHQLTEVTDIRIEKGKVAGVETDKGHIKTGKVLISAGGYGNLMAYKLGMRLPIHTLSIQAAVTQPLKPFLNPIVASGAYWIYLN